MKLFLRIVTLALILFLVWVGLGFIRGNEEAVRIDYLLSDASLPLWQALTIAFAIGWIAATSIFGWGWLRARMVARRYRKAHAKLKSEVRELRGDTEGAELDADAPAEASIAANAGDARSD